MPIDPPIVIATIFLHFAVDVCRCSMMTVQLCHGNNLQKGVYTVLEMYIQS